MKQNLKLSLAVLLSAAMPAFAQIANTWNGGGADANWSTAGNWSPGAPNPGDSLIFDGSTQTGPVNDFPADTGFGGIQFAPTATAAFTLTGNAIWFAGTVENDATNTLQTIALPMVLTNAATFITTTDEVTSTSANLEVAALVSGSGSLTKNGNGTLTLDSKSYGGGTHVNGGLLVVSNDNGGYTMSGGALKLNYGSYWSTPTIAFTADSQVGTEAGRLDFSGQMGSPGYTWTKIGTGTMNMTSGSADPTSVVKASAIVVAEGTLGCQWHDAGSVFAQWGGTNVPITVNYGAALSLNEGLLAPNSSITLAGGAGTGRGALLSGRIDKGANVTNTFTGNITLQSDTSIGTFGGLLVLAGNISGTGPLTKIGTSATSQNKLVLGGTNTWTGGFTISTGIVQLASSAALPSDVSITLYNDATLDLNGNNTTVNTIYDDGAGNAAIDNTSVNPATLTLTNGAFTGAVKNTGGGPLSIVNCYGYNSFKGPNSYTGSNVVQSGSLEITIPSGTTGGLVSVADGATLQLDYGAANSSLQASSAYFNGTNSGVNLIVNLNHYPNPSKPVINATNGSGVVTINGTVNFSFQNFDSLSGGTIHLIKYTSLAGVGSFTQPYLGAGITATIVTNVSTKTIDLVVQQPILTWTGKTNNLWDFSTTNWIYTGVSQAYADSNPILFDDTAKTNIVNLTTTVAPASTLVNTTNTYTFMGAGPLNGGQLTLNGSGKLVLATTNASGYGNTIIGSGTLQVGNGASLGSLGSGTVDDEAMLAFNLTTNISVPNTISGVGVVVNNNTNTTTLSSGNTYSGGTLVNQGVVKAGSTSAFGVPATGVALATVASGAALDLAGFTPTATNAVVISGNGNGTSDQGALFTSTGWTYLGGTEMGVNALSLAADATIGDNGSWIVVGKNGVNGIAGNNHNLTKVGNDFIAIEAPASSALASFTIANGGVQLYNQLNWFGSACILIISNNTSIDSWNPANWTGITVPNNIVIASTGGKILNSHGAYYGQANQDTYNGNITVNGQLTMQCTSTYTGNPNPGVPTYGKQTFNGSISGTGGVSVIIATGDTITLNNVANYSGPTINSAGIPAGSYGGKLLLSTVQQGGGAYTNNDGGVFDVPSQTGYTTVPMSTLAMLGTTNGATLSLSRVTSLTTNAPITATNLVLTGTNSILLPGLAFATAGQFQIIKYTTLSGGVTNLALGAAGVRGAPGYLTNNVANGSIDLVVPGGTPVYWTGSSSAIWDIASTLNWKTNGVATDYEQTGTLGDSVTFDDSTTKTNVTISTPVAPTLALINTTNTYTFSGSNITGAATLAKAGTGTLVLSNLNNTLTSGTFVSGGTLKLATAITPLVALNNLSGAATVASGATLDLGSNNLSSLTINAVGVGVNNNGAIQANYSGSGVGFGVAAINMKGNLTVGGNNRWDIRNGVNQLNVTTPGSVLTKVGAGQVSLVGTTVSTNLGDVVIVGGKLSVQTGATLGNTNNTVNIGGGSLDFNSATVAFTKNIVFSNNVSITGSGGTGPGNNVILTPLVFTNGATTLNISGGPLTFAGPINIPSGCSWNNNGNYYNTYYYSNVISGSGSFNQQFQTYINLYASNTFSGNITVPQCDATNNGAGSILRLIGNGSITKVPNITIQGISSGQRLPGILDVSGRVDGTLALTPNQTLRGDFGSKVNGTVVAGPGSTIWPGGDFNTNYTPYIAPTNFPNITLTALTMTGGILSFDVLNTTNDQIRVSGALSLSGSGTIRACYTPTSGLTNGSRFHLISYGTKSGTVASLQLALNGPHFAGAHLDDTTTANWVDLVIDNTNLLAPQNLTWAGDGGVNFWDTGSVNWLTNSGSPKTMFYQGDNVSFTDPATNPVVNLNATQTPGNITVNSSANYTFAGVGGITGGAILTKSGTGALVISTANTYTNGTLISGGTVSATTSTALGTGGVTNNGTLNLTAGAVTYTGLSAAMSGSGIVNVALGTGNGSTLLNGINSGFTGTLNVGTNGYTNTVAAAGAGKIQLNGVLAGSATVNVFPNATVYVSTAVTNPAALVLNGGDTGESLGQLRIEGNANWSGPVTVAGAITGSGDGHIGANSGQTGTVSGSIGGSAPLVTIAGGTVVLSGANTYSGGLFVNQGTTTLLNNQTGATGGYYLCTNNATGCTFNIGSGSQVSPTLLAVGLGKLVKIGALYPEGNSGFNGENLNVNGANGFLTTVTNASPLVAARGCAMTIGNYSIWNQSSNLTVSAYGGLGATLTVGNGTGSSGVFNYSGVNPIQLQEYDSATSLSILNINGGTLTTAQPFNYNGFATNTAYMGRLCIYNGGTLTLAGNVPQLTTGDASGQVQLGTNATINTAGYSTTLGTGLANISGQVGSLIVNGSGTLTLAGTNTYTGVTVVSNSTLVVSATGVVPTNTVTVATNATLGGIGLVRGTTTIQDGGTLKPGTTGIGTLIISNALSFSANSTNWAAVSLAGGVTNNSAVVGLGTVNYGGTLLLTNVGGTSLTVGASFKLFNATGNAGNFANIVDASGTTWSFTPATGIATVLTVPLTVNTNPATANFQATSTGSALHFTWAPDHLGWQLYTNSVNLVATNSWFPLAGSGSVTNTTVNINPAKTNVFFQLRYP